jgi:hypothetical protein
MHAKITLVLEKIPAQPLENRAEKRNVGLARTSKLDRSVAVGMMPPTSSVSTASCRWLMWT